MKFNNTLTNLLEIEVPVISGGMVWASGWRLVSAVSNCGGLGLLGAGSMKPELLREQIKKCRQATDKPFGVNIPLLRGDAEDLVNAAIEEGVKIVFSSAGNPAKFIDVLKKNDITVVHVVPSVKHALKAESVGCDAIVGEGVEAGGHNGPDEITTLCLIPQLVDAVKIPVIAAGGIADGRQMAACFCLGAQGAQIGTRFAATIESSASEIFKEKIVAAQDNGTVLALKKTGLTRLIKNNFAAKVLEAESAGATAEQLREILGKKREMAGMFEGDADEGALEAGQSSGLVKSIISVKDVFDNLLEGYRKQTALLSGISVQ
jgi:enoyl-[acyl-carrier protein] reductase II